MARGWRRARYRRALACQKESHSALVNIALRALAGLAKRIQGDGGGAGIARKLAKLLPAAIRTLQPAQFRRSRFDRLGADAGPLQSEKLERTFVRDLRALFQQELAGA